MGTSNDGQICFGILYNEIELPWDGGDGGDIDDWWIKEICKFKPTIEIYNNEGEFIDENRPTEEIIRKYHAERREFKNKNPLPVKLVNYCSAFDPLYIIAIPKTCKCANRGYPELFDPKDLNVTGEEIQDLVDFCKKYCTMDSLKPGWYLSSFLG